jgi:hypothetical protein
VPKELTTAIKQIHEAHADLIAGRYDSAVSRIRLGLDGVDKILTDDAARNAAIQSFAAGGDRPRDMPKRARSELVCAAIRHYTHLAHHVDASGNPESFSRHEATFILGAATSAIWDLIGSFRPV